MFQVGVLRIWGEFVLGNCSELPQVLLLNCEIFQWQFLILSLRSSHCILGFFNLDSFCIFLCFFFFFVIL